MSVLLYDYITWTNEIYREKAKGGLHNTARCFEQILEAVNYQTVVGLAIYLLSHKPC